MERRYKRTQYDSNPFNKAVVQRFYSLRGDAKGKRKQNASFLLYSFTDSAGFPDDPISVEIVMRTHSSGVVRFSAIVLHTLTDVIEVFPCSYSNMVRGTLSVSWGTLRPSIPVDDPDEHCWRLMFTIKDRTYRMKRDQCNRGTEIPGTGVTPSDFVILTWLFYEYENQVDLLHSIRDGIVDSISRIGDNKEDPFEFGQRLMMNMKGDSMWNDSDDGHRKSRLHYTLDDIESLMDEIMAFDFPFKSS